MKKFLKTIPASCKVLAILAVMFVVLGFIYNTGRIYSDDIATAGYITDGKYNEDYEGQLVCVSGKPELKTAPVDPLTGVTGNCFTLIRTVDMYQYTIENDEVYKMYLPYQEENIKGKKSAEYENPQYPEDLSNALITGEVVIGDIVIGEDFLAELDGDYSYFKKEYSMYAPLNLPKYKNSYGLKASDNGEYTVNNGENPEIGDIRIAYTYLRPKDIGEITVCGYMQNGKLVQSPEKSGIMVDSILTPEELAEIVKSDNASNPVAMWFMAGILMFISVVKFLFSRRKKGSV